MIYVLSDIHGNAKNFDAILQQICLQPEDILYILGDVIDRHPHIEKNHVYAECQDAFRQPRIHDAGSLESS